MTLTEMIRHALSVAAALACLAATPAVGQTDAVVLVGLLAWGVWRRRQQQRSCSGNGP
jgi:uncharacterized membrane protein